MSGCDWTKSCPCDYHAAIRAMKKGKKVMAGTPKFKVHDDTGRYVAATVDATLAAALIGAAGGEGWRVKSSGRVIWREGEETVHAAFSADQAAEIMNDRIEQWHADNVARYTALGRAR